MKKSLAYHYEQNFTQMERNEGRSAIIVIQPMQHSSLINK
uniref:Uncharacterized protein n=1 Tax=Rhizophora mucronata TaxID=61149 RepID=A0A2P2NW06_RHIMU